MAFTKRSIQAVMTKERIRNAALSLMRDKSIEEISVGDIIGKADVGVGTFYHYYKSKNDIVLELYNEMDAFFLQLAQNCDREAVSPSEYVYQHIICYTRFVTQNGGDMAKKVFAMESKVFLDDSRPVYATLKNFLEYKQDVGAVSPKLDVTDFCTYIVIFLRGLTYDWCLHDNNYDLSQRAISLADRILLYYKPLLQS